MTARRRVQAVILIGIVAAAVGVFADGYLSDRSEQGMPYGGNTEYDGRLVFVRLSYSMGFGNGFGRRMREPPWAHDYPTADTHLMKILKELTLAAPRIDGSNIFSLEDPELFDYPIAYMSEPGYWTLNDKEAAGLRNYLLKGGFIIFDDFRENEGHWYNLEEQMKRVMPEGRWTQLDSSHPIFHSFFEIDTHDLRQPYGEYAPVYYGMFEGNDPQKRLIAIANNNNDLGEYWEFSDVGMFPVDLSNEAYKFGVNYFMYGLIH